MKRQYEAPLLCIKVFAHSDNVFTNSDKSISQKNYADPESAGIYSNKPGLPLKKTTAFAGGGGVSSGA